MKINKVFSLFIFIFNILFSFIQLSFKNRKKKYNYILNYNLKKFINLNLEIVNIFTIKQVF